MGAAHHLRYRLAVLVLLAASGGLLGLTGNPSGLMLTGTIVALDPGHFETANDTGAVNDRVVPRLVERDVNWEVVLLTQAMLESLGATVILTRQDGQYLDRPTRYQIANDAGAHVLVSIHHNGNGDPSVNYTATFYTQPSDMMIAELTYQHLTMQFGLLGGGGVWYDTFGMTLRPNMPSTLTEAWFITHDVTAQQYLREASQRTSQTPGEGWGAGSLVEREAQALTEAIRAFLTSEGGGKGKPR